MKVSEIFSSVQGEGRRVGVVSIFVRLAGCDLRCQWCDTTYALNGEKAESLTVEEIIDRVEKYDCRQVVVTGGEPLIAPELPTLLDELKKRDRYITLETNATRYHPVECDLVSISPKLANSTPRQGPYAQFAEIHEKNRLNVGAIKNFMDNYDYQLKFVVEDENDLREIEDILRKLPGVDRDKVMLMPQAKTKQEYRKRGPRIAQLCLEKGFFYSPRLQLELWGRQRGK